MNGRDALMIRLGIDSSNIRRGLGKVSSGVKTLGNSVGIVQRSLSALGSVGASLGAMFSIDFITDAVTEARELDRALSKVLGHRDARFQSVDQLRSELGKVIDLSETLEKKLNSGIGRVTNDLIGRFNILGNFIMNPVGVLKGDVKIDLTDENVKRERDLAELKKKRVELAKAIAAKEMSDLQANNLEFKSGHLAAEVTRIERRKNEAMGAATQETDPETKEILKDNALTRHKQESDALDRKTRLIELEAAHQRALYRLTGTESQKRIKSLEMEIKLLGEKVKLSSADERVGMETKRQGLEKELLDAKAAEAAKPYAQRMAEKRQARREARQRRVVQDREKQRQLAEEKRREIEEKHQGARDDWNRSLGRSTDASGPSLDGQPDGESLLAEERGARAPLSVEGRPSQTTAASGIGQVVSKLEEIKTVLNQKLNTNL